MKSLIGFTFLASSLFMVSVESKNTKNSTNISGHIISGVTVTSLTAFPWHAAFFVNGKDPRTCGGSLIHPSWILTAAHCVSVASSLTITVGSTVCHTGGIQISATSFIVHHAFDPVNLHNDIALIKLPNALVLSTSIKIIKLMPRANCCLNGTQQKLNFSGCGTINGPVMPVNLWYTTLLEMSNMQCLTAYPTISVGTMCARSSTSNTCVDDDGGALVLPAATPLQVGILSFSASNCISSVVNNPSRFTRVCLYHDWLQSITGINFG